jgi:hypothetical protein
MVSAPSDPKTNPNFELRDSFLAPWGLSSEELPMHVLWSGDVDRIKMEFPSELDIVEVYNYSSKDRRDPVEDRKIVLSDEDLITSGYLGVVLKDGSKYSEPVKKHEISVSFSNQGEQLAHLKKTSRIIRPEIRVRDAPEEIHLSDGNVPDTIEIEMEYVGFGMAQVAVEAEAEGEFVSEGDSLLHDLLEALLETEVHKQDVDGMEEIPEEWENDSEIEVPQEEIEGIVGDMSNLAKSDEVMEKHDPQELMELAEALEEAEKMSESDSDVAAVIYRFIETALLSSILNVVDRHPTENVSLENPTTKIRTKARATELEVRIRLRDSLENEYDPETVIIDIIDERDSESGVLETEIETNWENYQVDPNEVFSDE